MTDDNIRWRAYYAIYRAPFLSAYAPGGGMLWGHRHTAVGGFHGIEASEFAGMEPAGDYPIHIIVKGGHVILLVVERTRRYDTWPVGPRASSRDRAA